MFSTHAGWSLLGHLFGLFHIAGFLASPAASNANSECWSVKLNQAAIQSCININTILTFCYLILIANN